MDAGDRIDASLARIRSRRPLWAVYPTRRLAALVFAAGVALAHSGSCRARSSQRSAHSPSASPSSFDYTRLPRGRNIEIERSIPESIGLGDVVELRYAIRTTWPWPVRVELFDDVPHGIGAAIPETSVCVGRRDRANASPSMRRV